MVVELEVGGVEKEDFANLGPGIFKGLAGVADVGGFGGALHDFAEIVEVGLGGEAVPFEDKLALQVFDLVERIAVGVFAFFEIGGAWSVTVFGLFRFLCHVYLSEGGRRYPGHGKSSTEREANE